MAANTSVQPEWHFIGDEHTAKFHDDKYHKTEP